MKFLLVLAVLAVAFWIWRNNRESEARDRRDAAPARPPAPQPMIACARCGTHVPEQEAVKGNAGHYCCAEHRRQHEASPR
ncbi:PP0621 family protein [Hydrogenophaga sp.]|uniref:PP0621 family protein n=1 Tax=Hydrogenophaga sp. TaxID=1904254 RepID=UPI0035B02C38